VIAELAQAKIRLECPPIALSARLALLGRSGDADALRRSNWARVQELIERVVVARAPTLRETGLRRRLASVASEAATVARRRALEREAASARRAEVEATLERAGRRLARGGDDLAHRLREVLLARQGEWERDVLPALAADRGRVASGFVRARTRILLGRPLTETLLQWLGLSDETAEAAATEQRLRRLLGPRLEAVSAALAPSLAPPAGGGRGASNGSERARREAASAALIEAGIEELRDVLSQCLARKEPDRVLPPERRALALAVALGVDDQQTNLQLERQGI
jgi:hypothetical protein